MVAFGAFGLALVSLIVLAGLFHVPGQAGLELLPALRSHNGRPVVIVLSGRPELEPAVRDAGAHAFFNLGEPPRRLLSALRAIQEGTPLK